MDYQNSNSQFILHDAVHGTIDLRFFDEKDNIILLGILNTPFLLRLKTVKQLGFAFHTHISADHNRFSHAIGTMYVMDQIFRKIEKSEWLNNSLDEINKIFSFKSEGKLEKDGLRKHLLVAGLLQDIGEVPFAQAIQEFIVPSKNVVDKLKQKCGTSYNGTVKEVFSLSAIYDEEIFDRLEELNINIDFFIFLITGRILSNSITEQPDVCNSLLNIMNGEVDADRLDYVFRDIHHSYGTKGNAKAIISTIIHYDAEGPVFDDPGPVTEFLLTRGHLWTTVYLNPENRFKTALLNTFFKEVSLSSSTPLKDHFRMILSPDENFFKEFDDLRLMNLLMNLLKDVKNSNLDYKLSNKAINALNNLLFGVEQYQWYWIPPTPKKQDATNLHLPIEVYYDLFLNYREHNLFSPKRIKIKADKFRKLGKYIFLEDCSGAFVGFAQTGWATLPKKKSILVFYPVKFKENDEYWKEFKNALAEDTLYAQLEQIGIKANNLELKINTWNEVNDDTPKIFVSFAFEDLKTAKRIATYIKDRGNKVKAIVTTTDGAGTDPTTNSVESVRNSDIVLLVISNNYYQKLEDRRSHVSEEFWNCSALKKQVILLPIQKKEIIKNLDFPWEKLEGINGCPNAPLNVEEAEREELFEYIESALNRLDI